MASPASVDDYLFALPAERRATMDELRQTIRAAAPEATETIAYQMPAFKSHGRILVCYAAFKDHYSLFPTSAIEALGEEVRPYVAGKGTIRFRADEPIPRAIVTRIVQVRLAENAARDGR